MFTHRPPSRKLYLVATLGKLKTARKGAGHPSSLCWWLGISVPLTGTPPTYGIVHGTHLYVYTYVRLFVDGHSTIFPQLDILLLTSIENFYPTRLMSMYLLVPFQCFINLKDEELDPVYCSGGDHLSIWDHNMNLLYTYKRRSLDCM